MSENISECIKTFKKANEAPINHIVEQMTRPDDDRIDSIEPMIEKAESVSVLVLALSEIASTFGFIHFTLMNVPFDSVTLIQSLIHFTTLPQPFIAAYDQAGLLRGSFFAKSVRHGPSPLEWTLEGNQFPDNAEGTFSRRLKAMHVHMGAAFTDPVCDADRLSLLLFGDRAPLSKDEKAAITYLSERAFRRFRQLRPASVHHFKNLSSRELEVIRWTAEGKTSHEIGTILNLSDHTVNAYLANAIRKLECVNRTQLVAKAIRMKLIE